MSPQVQVFLIHRATGNRNPYRIRKIKEGKNSQRKFTWNKYKPSARGEEEREAGRGEWKEQTKKYYSLQSSGFLSKQEGTKIRRKRTKNTRASDCADFCDTNKGRRCHELMLWSWSRPVDLKLHKHNRPGKEALVEERASDGWGKRTNDPAIAIVPTTVAIADEKKPRNSTPEAEKKTFLSVQCSKKAFQKNLLWTSFFPRCFPLSSIYLSPSPPAPVAANTRRPYRWLRFVRLAQQGTNSQTQRWKKPPGTYVGRKAGK